MLYCGRKTRGGPDIDFLAHFAGRNLQAKGHPYVAFVNVPESRIEEELAVLLEAVTATGMLDEENEDTRLQREHLEKVVGWAERIERDLHELIWHHDLPVFFRPGTSGVAMVGLTSDLPQRGRSGYTNLKKLNENFESLFLTHCITAKQGRPTPEKQLQSYLIRNAVRGSVDRWLTPLNEASEKTDAP
jgi:hypothetical protein